VPLSVKRMALSQSIAINVWAPVVIFVSNFALKKPSAWLQTRSQLNVLIAGVGGQGVVLASDILAEVAMGAGLDVKKTDTLGMAQRGGSVISHVAISEDVASPVISEGEADILLAFEKAEAARWSGYLRNGGIVIVNDLSIPPLSVSLGSESYPDDAEILPKVLNVIMLGALSMLTPFNPDLWGKEIGLKLPPHLLDINLTAFELGRREMLQILSGVSDEGSCSHESQDGDCGCP
jgi:indolepyruvate ferredoxin oxidoreductase beta subunit